jgi:hypothetical protein
VNEDDDLKPCRDPGRLQSTDAMRKRIRELSRPTECDYDRAVIAVLDDLEMRLTGVRRAADALWPNRPRNDYDSAPTDPHHGGKIWDEQ